MKEIKFLSKNDKGLSVEDIKTSNIGEKGIKYFVKIKGKKYILAIQKISTYVFTIQEENVQYWERYGFGNENIKVNGLSEFSKITELQNAIRTILIEKGLKDLNNKSKTKKIIDGGKFKSKNNIKNEYIINGIDGKKYEIDEIIENDIDSIKIIDISNGFFNKEITIGKQKYIIKKENGNKYLYSKTGLDGFSLKPEYTFFDKLKLLTLKSGEEFILILSNEKIRSNNHLNLIFNDGSLLVKKDLKYKELIGIKKIDDITFDIITKNNTIKANKEKGLTVWDDNDIIGHQIIKDTVQIREQTHNKLTNGKNANQFGTLQMNNVIFTEEYK